MNDEQAFLARIHATPDDVAPRLVYADWLEEHDDPRGELIRVAEEMRPLPVYAERYWTLKARYKKLKGSASHAWRAELGYNRKRLMLQHGFPDDVPSRWRLIRECVERWFDIDMPDIGGHTLMVADFQRSFGRRVPVSLREYISFREDLKEGLLELNQYFGELQLTHLSEPDGLLLSFGGADRYSAVLSGDFHHDDPPVYFSDWSDTDISDAELSSATVTEHIFDFVTDHLRSDCGGFEGRLLPHHQAVHAWLATFSHQCRLRSRRYFENADYFVRLEEHAGAATPATINVQLLSEVANDAIPACVWDMANESQTGHGIFNPWNRWQ